LIRIENLWYRYSSGENWVLKNVNIFLNDGEIALLIGPNGSGKTTLAKAAVGILPSFYGGEIKGKIFVGSVNVLEKPEEAFKYVGYVGEDPEVQLVTLTVRDEVMFGPSNLGLPLKEVFERAHWALNVIDSLKLMNRVIFELSGGEMQRVAIASILALKPRVLILDEPSAFIEAPLVRKLYGELRKIADEEGISIIIIEHKLDQALKIADKLIILRDGEVVSQRNIKELSFNEILKYQPQERIREEVSRGVRKRKGSSSKAIVKLQNVWYRYPRSQKYSLKNISLNIAKGVKLGILGPNGSGKSTLIKIIAGILKPSKGYVTRYNNLKVGYVPQNPTLSFTRPTPYDEVYETARNMGVREPKAETWRILKLLGLERYSKKPVLHLSFGYRRRLSLASALVGKPDIVLLDEPTAYLDFEGKTVLAEILNNVAKQLNTTLVIASHDTWFISEVCDVAVLLYDGEIKFEGETNELLKIPSLESFGVEKPFNVRGHY